MNWRRRGRFRICSSSSAKRKNNNTRVLNRAMAAIFSLTGKRILVTGASSGIGREVCRTAALAGAAVVASGRDGKRLTETVEGLAGEGHLAVRADLTEDA